ncbi:GTP-binding protein Rho1, partial [Serendipita sp. 399]
MERKKVVIIGDGACGKTSLVMKIVTGEWHTYFMPTVFEISVIEVTVGGKVFELSLVDTAGQEDYERLRPIAYSGAHVVLICFCIAHPDSLDNVYEKWAQEVEFYCPNVPILVVGCQSDRRTEAQTLQSLSSWGQTPTTPEMGEAVARQIGAERYIDCSAKNDDGINMLFEQAARASMHSRHKITRRLLFVGDSDS